MANNFSRRQFIAAGIAALVTTRKFSGTGFPKPTGADSARIVRSPFRIAVITDEISQDFGHACEVASQQFGMGWVEIRGAWNKNVTNFDAHEISEILNVLKKNSLRVTDI